MSFLINLINLCLFAFGTALLWSPAVKDVLLSIIILGIIITIFKDNELMHIFKKTLTTNKFVIASVLLFLMVLIGGTYGDGSSVDKLVRLKKYSRLLLAALLMPWFLYCKKSRNSLLNGLIFGTSLFALVSLFLHTNRHTGVNPIPISLIFSVITLIVFVKIFLSKKVFSVLSIIFLIDLHYLFLINEQKSGILTFLIVSSVFSLIMFFAIKVPQTVKLFAIILVSSSILFFAISLKKNIRIKYQSTNFTDSSYADRINLIKNGLKLAKEAPIIGHGTGSFKNDYSKMPDALRLPHSHNDYIETLVQFGIVGLIVFLVWIVSPLAYFNNLRLENKYAIGILILSYSIAANFDCMFISFCTRDFYVFLISSLLAGSKDF